MFFVIFGSVVLTWTLIRVAVAMRRFGVFGVGDSRPLTVHLSLWLIAGLVTLVGGLVSIDSRVLAVAATGLLMADLVLRKLAQAGKQKRKHSA